MTKLLIQVLLLHCWLLKKRGPKMRLIMMVESATTSREKLGLVVNMCRLWCCKLRVRVVDSWLWGGCNSWRRLLRI